MNVAIVGFMLFRQFERKQDQEVRQDSLFVGRSIGNLTWFVNGKGAWLLMIFLDSKFFNEGRL